MSDSFRDMIYMKNIVERKIKEVYSGNTELIDAIKEMNNYMNNVINIVNELKNRIDGIDNKVNKIIESSDNKILLNEQKIDENKNNNNYIKENIEFIPDIDIDNSFIRLKE